MKILKSWLNDWIDIENISNSDISEALESLGFEIENKKELSPNYENIVVGKVLDVYEHPNADKVRITKTDVGNNIYEIVCGAWNFDVGAVVPVALPNSEIKDNFVLVMFFPCLFFVIYRLFFVFVFCLFSFCIRFWVLVW